MPLARITIRSGKSNGYRKALLDGVHNALVEAFKIPVHDRMQMLDELAFDRFEALPGKTDNVTVIEIMAFKGRSAEARKALYGKIVRNLGAEPGIEGTI